MCHCFFLSLKWTIECEVIVACVCAQRPFLNIYCNIHKAHIMLPFSTVNFCPSSFLCFRLNARARATQCPNCALGTNPYNSGGLIWSTFSNRQCVRWKAHQHSVRVHYRIKASPTHFTLPQQLESFKVSSRILVSKSEQQITAEKATKVFETIATNVGIN